MRLVQPALTLALLLPVAAGAAEPATKPEDPFAPVRTFVGAWKGTSEGESGAGVVDRTYEMVLDGRYLHERNRSDYSAGKPEGEVHDHWSFFSFDRARQRLVLRQFHEEGFVNQYVFSPELSTPGKLVFDSEGFENFSNTWRAREIYEIKGPDEIVEIFALAPPGKDFAVYSRTHLKRVAAGGF